jgi:hypothetical protein
MSANLRLVVNKTSPADKIVASIRPLGEKVAPSEAFRLQTKMRLLALSGSSSKTDQAA